MPFPSRRYFVCFALFISSLNFLCSANVWAEGKTVSLWEGKAPGALGTEPKDNPEGILYSLATDQAKDDTHPCLVILPGGGYGNLAIDHEGHQIAAWANSMGMVGFICKYRHRRDGYGHPAPMLDAQRAIRLARANAEAWKINPQKVGIIGFSAGGHLASTVLTHFDQGDASATDSAAKQSSRPDFGILAYPVIGMGQSYTHAGSQRNLLGTEPDPKLIALLNNDQHVTAETPPTFLFHTQEDASVLPENSLAFYSAMVRHKVPGELHFFQKGKHGVGLGRDIVGTNEWSNLCKLWLKQIGIVEPTGTQP
jgi:acetyl esterase/lipase